MAYGNNTIGTVGRSIVVAADGAPECKIGGVTIDWSTVAAVSGSDAVLADGITVPVGGKYLRYGQCIAKIAASGLYGPWDIAQTDGRQLLTAGEFFVLNKTAVFGEPLDDYPQAIYGGRVWQARIIQSGTATHTLAAGPTLAELKAALPRLQLVTGA